MVNQVGKNFARQLPPDSYEQLLKTIHQEVARKMIEKTRATVKKQIQIIEEMATQQLPMIRKTAIAAMHAELDGELQRLRTLKKRNPTIRMEEVQALSTQISDLEERLQSSTVKLSALRVIYTH